MKVDREKKRLNAIKLRYGVNARCVKYFYCQNCMKSASDVLNEIDTDAIPLGIAGVDEVYGFRKKDYTMIRATRAKYHNN